VEGVCGNKKMDTLFSCAICGIPTTKVCYGCLMVARCGKECQQIHTTKHSIICPSLRDITIAMLRETLPVCPSGIESQRDSCPAPEQVINKYTQTILAMNGDIVIASHLMKSCEQRRSSAFSFISSKKTGDCYGMITNDACTTKTKDMGCVPLVLECVENHVWIRYTENGKKEHGGMLCANPFGVFFPFPMVAIVWSNVYGIDITTITYPPYSVHIATPHGTKRQSPCATSTHFAFMVGPSFFVFNASTMQHHSHHIKEDVDALVARRNKFILLCGGIVYIHNPTYNNQKMHRVDFINATSQLHYRGDVRWDICGSSFSAQNRFGFDMAHKTGTVPSPFDVVSWYIAHHQPNEYGDHAYALPLLRKCANMYVDDKTNILYTFPETGTINNGSITKTDLRPYGINAGCNWTEVFQDTVAISVVLAASEAGYVNVVWINKIRNGTVHITNTNITVPIPGSCIKRVFGIHKKRRIAIVEVESQNTQCRSFTDKVDAYIVQVDVGLVLDILRACHPLFPVLSHLI
jgi:hypothetical protein